MTNQERPLTDPSRIDTEPTTGEATPKPPSTGSDLRVAQVVHDVLDATPGGDAARRYFGVGGGTPEQPPREAEESFDLIQGLRAATHGEADLPTLLDEIASHANSSEADATVLRALREFGRKHGHDAASPQESAS